MDAQVNEVIAAEYMFSLQTSLTRALRSLTNVPGLTVKMRWSRNGRNSASTSGKYVEIVVVDNDVTSTKNLVFVLGLAYHEMGHVLFTPKNIHGIGGTYLHTLNILEDQRMESMVVALYPAITNYFKIAYARMVTDTDDDASIACSYALTYGRRYLPGKVVKASREKFVEFCGEANTVRVEEIIDEYRMMNLPRIPPPGKCQRIVELVEELHAILPNNSVPTMHDRATTNNSMGADADAAEMKELQDEANELVKQGADRSDDDEDDGADDAGESKDDSGRGDEGTDSDVEDADNGGAGDDAESGADGPDDGSGDDDAEGAGDSASDDSRAAGDDVDGNDLGSVSNGLGAGRGNGATEPPEPPDIDGLLDVIGELLDDTMSDADVSNDIRDWKNSMSNGNAIAVGKPTVINASNDLILNGRNFSGAISAAVRPDIDPGWDRGYSSGRINIGRAMMDASYDELFDRWYEGHNDAFNIDAIIAMDISSSMKMYGTEVAESAWVIRNGIEQLQHGICATIAWGDFATWLIGEGKQDTRRVSYPYVGGGTSAVPMLSKAMVRFTSQPHRANNRVLFILTDGDWQDAVMAHQMIEQLRREGVIVVVVGLRYTVRNPTGANLVLRIDKPGDLVTVAQSTVTEIYKKAGAGLVGRRY